MLSRYLSVVVAHKQCLSMILCLALQVFPFSAHAAKVYFDQGVISITGIIDANDYKLFQNLIEKHKGFISQVHLNSLGGNTLSAIRIGDMVRKNNLHTIVLDNEKCASACGLIWLGGTKRTIERNGAVGFHASYQIRNGKKEESGQSNAITGAYLNSLGLSLDAIVLVTQSPPSKITWLTESIAKNVGIIYDIQVPSNLARFSSQQPTTNAILQSEFDNIPLIADIKISNPERYQQLWKLFKAEIHNDKSLDVATSTILKALYRFALSRTATSSDNVIRMWIKIHKDVLKKLETNNPKMCIQIHNGDLTLLNELVDKLSLLDFYDAIVLDQKTFKQDSSVADIETAYMNAFRIALWRSSDFQKLVSKHSNNMAAALNDVLKPNDAIQTALLCTLLNGTLEALEGTQFEVAYYREKLTSNIPKIERE